MIERWLYLPFLLWVVNAEQEIVEGPQDTFVNVGHTVILKCKVDNQKGEVQWTKNDFGLGTDRSLKLFSRYSMVGSSSNGEFNLQIVNVSVSDDDIYRCQIGEVAHERAVLSSPAKLTVLMRPTPPKMMKSGLIRPAIAGEKISESCLVRKGKPPAKLGWAIAADSDGRHIITWLGETRARFGSYDKRAGLTRESVDAEVMESIQKENHIFNVISNISFVPRPEDDRKYLVCLSQHETFPEKLEADSQKLELQYAPRVNLTIASKHRLEEGGSALLACNVDAKPLENIKISWYRNNEPLPQHTDTLTFERLKMENHNVEYSCRASNVIGSNIGSIKLNVAFGARIMSTKQEKEVNEGETTSFHCQATGNPTPHIYWTKSGDNQIIAKGELLSIENVRSWQQGEYICTAAVDGFPAATRSHFLYIRGPPTVSLEEEQASSVGESTDIVCRIAGKPTPSEVKWTKDGNELMYSSGRLLVHQVPQPYGIESRLTIKNVKESDFGIYNCSANNGFGAHSMSLSLRSRNVIEVISSLDLFTIFPLICAAVLMLLLLGCCILCRRKRSSKKGMKFFDDQSDVTVKCEALDGGQFFSDIYSSPLDNANLITSKDYISIPQNNPDLDYMGPPSSFGPSLYPKYMNSSLGEYMGPRYEHSYGSFASGVSTPAGLSDVYGMPCDKVQVLETLSEVDSPKTTNYNIVGLDNARPTSRSSTHV